jgi:hypothetical protein
MGLVTEGVSFYKAKLTAVFCLFHMCLLALLLFHCIMKQHKTFARCGSLTMDFGCQNQELNFFFFINYPLSGIL